MCFRKDERSINVFKKLIHKNPGASLNTMGLDFQTKNKFAKESITEDIIMTLFKSFSQQTISFFKPFDASNN